MGAARLVGRWRYSWRHVLVRHGLIFLTVAALGLAGCGSFFTGEKKVLPPPLEYSVISPYSQTHTMAIAPAINLSGSRDFDPLVVSDKLYEEMQQVQNLNVLPLNKTLLAMERLGIRSIDDVKTAQRLAEYLQADGLVVPAVTAYDPYNPPLVGMVLQLYTPEAKVAPAAPVAVVKPASVRTNPDRVIFATDIPAATGTPRPDPLPERQPASQVSAVFNATNQSVLRELRLFAAGRSQYDSALAEQKFLMDSDSYMRFVCHAMTRRLMDVERERISDR
jgi:hypothetical protein